MTNYRRNRVPGATYFFTVNLADRNSDLLVREVDSLCNSVRKWKARLPFYIDAWVVLPEHMHCVWTLPEQDKNYSARWQAIKTEFSKRLPPTEHRTLSRLAKGERGIWQRRFWEHTILDEQDYAVHIDYVHFNPVKHGLVNHPNQWRFSSFRRSLAAGLYPSDRAGRVAEPCEVGEPQT